MGFKGKLFRAASGFALRVPNRRFVLRALTIFLLLVAPALSWAAERALLWEIGRADGDNREFALAPNQFEKYSEDGAFFVGESEAARDWPYAQPGPIDSWAGAVLCVQRIADIRNP